MEKSELKQRAISMRRAGFTYGEIQAVMDVSLSALSNWLRDIELTSEQQQRIKAKRVPASMFRRRKP